jgi:hypothetical protein
MISPLRATRLPSSLHTIGKACYVEDLSRRVEERAPVANRVDLSSLDVRRPTQEALATNVSLHGARVLANKPWKPNDRLDLRSLLGNFRARARVIYCQALGTDLFAMGLQLIATTGKWK